MYRFDTSWLYKILSTFYRDALRVVPTCRDRFYVSWGICSLTLVFVLTQILFTWRYLLNALEQANHTILLKYVDFLSLTILLVIWQWGVWYVLKLGLLYWMKDRLPLWANSSIVSCGISAVVNWLCFTSSTYQISIGLLSTSQVGWLLTSSFVVGVILPTLNNQRRPNKYFA